MALFESGFGLRASSAHNCATCKLPATPPYALPSFSGLGSPKVAQFHSVPHPVRTDAAITRTTRITVLTIFSSAGEKHTDPGENFNGDRDTHFLRDPGTTTCPGSVASTRGCAKASLVPTTPPAPPGPARPPPCRSARGLPHGETASSGCTPAAGSAP